MPQPVQCAVAVSSKEIRCQSNCTSAALAGFPVVPTADVFASDSQLEAAAAAPTQLPVARQTLIGFALELSRGRLGDGVPVRCHTSSNFMPIHANHTPSSRSLSLRNPASLPAAPAVSPVPGSATAIPSPSRYCRMAASPISERFIPVPMPPCAGRNGFPPIDGRLSESCPLRPLTFLPTLRHQLS